MKSIYDFQNWESEATVINGSDIERFYLGKDNSIVRSEILYKGSSNKDAQENLKKYWQPPKTWYVFGGSELRYC